MKNYIHGCMRITIKIFLPVFGILALYLLLTSNSRQQMGHHLQQSSEVEGPLVKVVDTVNVGEKNHIDQHNTVPTGYKAIYYATSFFNRRWPIKYRTLSLCQVDSCVITEDKNLADALVYHGNSLLVNNEYVNQLWRERQLSNQTWVFFEKEPPILTKLPLIRYLTRFNGLFNWTATYKRTSDLHTGYGIAVRFNTTVMSLDDAWGSATYDKKTRFGVIVTSNCLNTGTDKWQILQALQKHGLHIDIFGKCTNKPYSQPYKSGYKFYFAFQNSRCQDYTTEKIWITAYKNNLVPVILGGKNEMNLAEELPPNSYIHVHDFRTTHHLVEYLLNVSTTKALYESYFTWKTRWKVYPNHFQYSHDTVTSQYMNEFIAHPGKKHLYPGRELDLVCKLCKALHENVSVKLLHHLEHLLITRLTVIKHN